MNRSDWQTLADIRILEAQALLAMNPPLADGAYYLAGYAVECALKAAIARLNNQYDWPEKVFVNDSHTHKIPTLVRLAGLVRQRDADAAADALFAKNWLVVEDWNEQSRYELHSEMKARDLIAAITDTSHGVLPWIRARW